MSLPCFDHYLNEVAQEVGQAALPPDQRDMARQAAAARAMSNTQDPHDQVVMGKLWTELANKLHPPAKKAFDAFCESRGYHPVAQN